MDSHPVREITCACGTIEMRRSPSTMCGKCARKAAIASCRRWRKKQQVRATGRKVQQKKRDTQRRMAQAALEATRRAHKPVTASHLMHAPPELFTRWVNDILQGKRGLVGGA